MKRRNMIAASSVAFGLGGLVALLSWSAIMYTNEAVLSDDRPTWTEVSWPFAPDEWGKGKAFRCKTADCGTEINVYIRAKIGFCNCTTGVADDDELNRLSDVILMGEKIEHLGPGRPIRVALDEGPKSFLCGRKASTRRTFGSLGSIQRSLRRYRCNRRDRSWSPGRCRANNYSFPERRHCAALGRRSLSDYDFVCLGSLCSALLSVIEPNPKAA